MVSDFEQLKIGYPHAYAEFIEELEKKFQAKESNYQKRISRAAEMAAKKETEKDSE